MKTILMYDYVAGPKNMGRGEGKKASQTPPLLRLQLNWWFVVNLVQRVLYLPPILEKNTKYELIN